MVELVLDSLNDLEMQEVITVVGHGAERVKEVLGDRTKFVLQVEQLGTAHAVKVAKDELKDKVKWQSWHSIDLPVLNIENELTIDNIDKIQSGYAFVTEKDKEFHILFFSNEEFKKLLEEKIKENAREWEMRDSMGYSLPHLPDRLRLIYALRSRNAVSTRRLELFLQDTWRRHTAAGLLNLTAGLRLSHSDLNGETLLSPRLSLGFLPAGSERWTFRFATGLYYQPPFYKELRDTTLSDGIATVRLNRDIKSQRSVHFVLGGDYTFRLIGRPFKFTTEVYYKALSRLIPYTVDNVRIVYAGRNLSSGYAAGVDFKLFGEFVPGTDSWLTLSLMKTEEKIGGVWLPRPTDQRFNLSLHFTDYFPGSTRWTLTLRAALAAGLPFGPPHSDRTVHTFRAPAYKRVDVGLNYCLFRAERRNGRRPLFGTGRFLNNAWLGLDCFNLPGIRNVNAYYWVTDITNTRYAVPNYLTGRLLNLRLALEF